MKAMLDLNVLLDVIQNRQPHYLDSATVVSAARSREFVATIPVHAVTTIFYIISRISDRQTAEQTIDWLLQYFEVAAADKGVLVQARSLPMRDFEDAVVASAAHACRCDRIITRNVADFVGSPVDALSPSNFLRLLHNTQS